jgi:Ceramidase
MATWSDWAQATCMPDRCFCEAIGEGTIRQPANTWSSLAFCVAGALVLLEMRKRPEGQGISALQALCFALAAMVVGLGSAFYHASLTFLGQWFDVEGMYLLALVGVCANVDALRPNKPKVFVPLYFGLNAVMGVLLATIPFMRRYAFFAAIVGIIVTELLVRKRGLRDWPPRRLWTAIGLMAVAFVIWTVDLTHTVCDPHSLLQGHAVWHVLGACATYALWRYYRPTPSGTPASEPPRP